MDSALLRRYEAATAPAGGIEAARTERRKKRASITNFLQTLARQENLITEFDEELWYITVDRVKVYGRVCPKDTQQSIIVNECERSSHRSSRHDGRLLVVFRDGGEVGIASDKR